MIFSKSCGSFSLIKFSVLYSSLFLFAVTLPFTPSTSAKHRINATSHQKETIITPSPKSPPQIEIFEAHQGENKTYVISLDSNHGGATLIAYNSPTCQANTHGTTIINSKTSKLEFTAKEDPFCKITMQKNKNNQLKIIKETAPCSTWHGDFCSFTSLSSLTRIYPKQSPKEPISKTQ